MDRRKFLEISAATTAVIMTGALNGFADARIGDYDSFEYNSRKPRMFGGCGDSRMMNDMFPGFLEREIIDFGA